MTNSLTSGLLGQMNLGSKLEKALGFNSGQIEDMQTFNKTIGGLAGQGVNYALGGDFTMNALNLSMLNINIEGERLEGGLFEVKFGRDGVSTAIGAGGVDMSLGTIASAMAGLGHWGKNIDIEEAAKRNGVADAATGLRGLYGFGDAIDKAELESVLKGKTKLLAGIGGEGAQTETIDGVRYITLNGVSGADTAEKKLALALTLSHEGRRDGVADENNKAETRTAVWAHTEMALRMLKDNATSSVMKAAINGSENLQKDLGAYMTAKMKGDDTIFGKYVDGTYDSSADYWKLIVNDDGSHEFKWDGHLNIYGEDGKMISHYRVLDAVIQSYGEGGFMNNGKEEIVWNGATISIDELRELQRYNHRIINYANKNPSTAATSLLNDGYMSYEEAKKSTEEIRERFSLFGVNMREHWSVRYVSNDMGNLVAAIGENTGDWIKESDKKNADEWFVDSFATNVINNITFEILRSRDSKYHGTGNFKWQSNENGNEQVFRNGEVETDPKYTGTFNFGLNGIDHFFLDFLPYQIWGNSPDDMNISWNRQIKKSGALR
jgi:hypothetical protein